MRITTLFLLSLAAALPASAADVVTDAMQVAYVPYRAALFRTNGQGQAEAEQAIASARQGWQSIVDRFAAKPLPPYDRDPAFATTLEQVAEVYSRAEGQIRNRQLPQAHETLEQARDLMAALRQRNGVVVYSDHMNAYHAEMEHMLGEGPKLLAQPQGMLLTMAGVGTLEYLARQLRSEAPKELARDADFAPLLQAVDNSLSALRAAVLSQDAAAIRTAIGKLKGPYSKLFLRFG